MTQYGHKGQDKAHSKPPTAPGKMILLLKRKNSIVAQARHFSYCLLVKIDLHLDVGKNIPYHIHPRAWVESGVGGRAGLWLPKVALLGETVKCTLPFLFLPDNPTPPPDH